MVEPIGEMLGADRVVATRMEIVDGKYTGEIDFYAYGENKATAIRELADEHGYDLARCYAYSDSVTDLHMLEAVGHPYAVNPDKDLRKDARERGWPVLVFDKPVALRSRVRLPPASRRWPRWRSAGPPRSARPGGRTRVAGALAAPETRAPTRPPAKSSLVMPAGPAYKGGQQLRDPHGAGTHAANYPS